MGELTCGERVVRCLLGEPIDRVPYGVGIGWGPWLETLQRWRRESGDPELAPQKTFGFDASFVGPAIHSGLWPPFEHKVIEETQEFIVFRDGRGITLRGRRDGHSMPEWIDYPVKAEADWEQLKEERLRIDDPTRIAQDWAAFRARIKQTGEAVQVGAFPYGVFGTPRDLMGFEELLVSFHTAPALVRDMMEHLTALWISLWEKVAAEVQIDQVHIWEDMAGKQGSLISPRMVREFMMPCYDRIADFARSAGVRIISVDTDGDCRQLVPVMMEHGVNLFFPFEVQAGSDILEYRRLYPKLGIMGGLDKRALAATRAEIDREVEKAARMTEKGRYLPGFDHLIPPDVPWENYRYAAEQIKRVCYGLGISDKTS
jgi:uroporphyrinogen decarboxylase